MKRFLSILVFGLSFSLLVPSASAISKVSGDVEEDLYFSGSVLIEGVDPPSNATASTGATSVTIGGSGTVTVASRSGGGLPRMTLYGGTRLTSTRNWGDTLNKSWWEGQFSAPANGRQPVIEDINFGSILSANSSASVLGSFNLGLANETFTFSQPATFIFPVRSEDSLKLWIAVKQTNGAWSISGNDYCLVENGICGVELSSMNEVALVRENYSRCPQDDIANGEVGTVPSCKIVCHRGYELDATLTECIPELEIGDDFSDAEEVGMDDFEDEFGLDEPLSSSYGAHSFKGSRVNLLGADIKEAKKEETAEEKLDRVQDDSFINYLLQMRNHFGEASSPNVFGAETEIALEDGESELLDMDMELLMDESVHSSAPMLPSTGPGIFLGIAVLGAGMMLVGSRKR